MSTDQQIDFINTKSVTHSFIEETETTPNAITFFKYRLLKTIFLFLSWICLGLFSEILGPALPCLRILTDSNYEEISRSLSARAAGLLMGSVIGGLLSDRFLHNRSFLIFIFLSLAGITVATIPLCHSLIILSLNLFISGFSHGAFTTAGNPLLGSLWKRPTGPYNFMHSGYGFGAAVAPLLLNHFDNTNLSVVMQSLNATSDYSQLKESAKYIQSSFSIVGIFCIIVGLVFLVYCFVTNPVDLLEGTFCRKQNKIGIGKIKSEENPRTLIANLLFSIKSYFRKITGRFVLILAICFVSYFGIVGNERVFGKFQFTYATEGHLRIKRHMGYIINCLYWVSFCLARIVTALVAIKVSAKLLLIVEICGTIISSLIFTIWNKSPIVFFVFSTCFGFFKSPLFPTMLGVLSLYSPISGAVVTIVNFGSAAGAMCCQYLAGYLIQYYGHYTFPITVTVTGALLAVIFLVMLLITRKWKHI